MSVLAVSSALYRIGQSMAGTNKSDQNTKENAKESWLDSVGSFVDSLSKPVIPSPAGCGSDARPVVDQLEDGGIPTEIELPDNVWFPTIGGEGGAEGSRFIDKAEVETASEPISGSGVQNEEYIYFGVGIDSTLIPGMPEEGCFPAQLTDVTPVSEEWWEMGFGCHTEEGITYNQEPYREFLVCPSNENWQPPLFVGAYQIKCYDKDGETIHDTGLITRSTLEELEQGTAERLGAACGDYQLSKFRIPQECYHIKHGRDGTLNAVLGLTLYRINQGHIKPDHIYRADPQGKVYIPEEGE